MRILVTNDDGINAKGLHALANVAKQFGDVRVVAPDRERSACGHSMTLHDPLRIKPVDWPGIKAYQVNGVPVDCVNVGLAVAWPDGCDLVISGWNHGPNLGYDVTYSGTVAGAMEGCINGIRSIAFSIALFVEEAPPHFETASRWLTEKWEWITSLDLPPRTFLNVNLPSIDYPELRGERFAPMGGRVYQDRVEERSDPWGRTYFWQGGVAAMDGYEPDTDIEAIRESFVSITPVSLNWTDATALERLRQVAAEAVSR